MNGVKFFRHLIVIVAMKRFIFLKLFLPMFLLLDRTWSLDNFTIPGSDTKIFIEGTKLVNSFTEAEAECKSIDATATLVILDYPGILNFVLIKLKDITVETEKGFYIGLKASGSSYKWVDDTSLTKDKSIWFYPPSSDDILSKPCPILYKIDTVVENSATYPASLGPATCTTRKHYICGIKGKSHFNPGNIPKQGGGDKPDFKDSHGGLKWLSLVGMGFLLPLVWTLYNKHLRKVLLEKRKQLTGKSPNAYEKIQTVPQQENKEIATDPTRKSQAESQQNYDSEENYE